MAEMDAWPIYEINQNSFLDFCRNDKGSDPVEYIGRFVKDRFASHTEVLTRVMLEVERIMRHFGLLGGRYPFVEIEGVVKSIDRCLAMLGDEARSAGNKEKRYILAWEANLTYLRLSLLSDRHILGLIQNGDTRPQSLTELVRLDLELLRYIETMPSSSFLHSEYVTNRIKKRMSEVEEMAKEGSSTSPQELERLWRNR